jgi:hypothetical protein
MEGLLIQAPSLSMRARARPARGRLMPVQLTRALRTQGAEELPTRALLLPPPMVIGRSIAPLRVFPSAYSA